MYLVGNTIQHVEACKAMGKLDIPAWKSAPVRPLLCPDGCHLALFVHDRRFIPFDPTLFLPGRTSNNIGDALTPDSIVLCLSLDFTAPPREHNVGFCTYDFSGHAVFYFRMNVYMSLCCC